MIKTSNLTYQYSDSDSFNFPDISLKPNEHALVLGASGIGKTTLLHLLAGLIVPKEGSVTIGETELNSLNRNERDKFRGEHIGVVFQQYHFIQSLNVEENLRLRQSVPVKGNDDTRREELLERLGLIDLRHKNVSNLSQGQQQRLSIALGLIHKPKVILADEPTSNLDDSNCVKVISLLKEEAKICNSNLVIITHDNRIKPHFKNQILL